MKPKSLFVRFHVLALSLFMLSFVALAEEITGPELLAPAEQSTATASTENTPPQSASPLEVVPEVPTPPTEAATPEIAEGDPETKLKQDADNLRAQLNVISQLIKQFVPSVVHIKSTPLAKYKKLANSKGEGAGVIVEFDNRFYILTNRHILRYSKKELVEIYLNDGRVLTPEKIWSDGETDVAVLSFNEDESDITPAKIGDSDLLELGEMIIVVGAPYGLSQSVAHGIISAIGRHDMDFGDVELKWQDFLQTDAVLNPGNSGGPMFNLNGEFVAINTATASTASGGTGVGFSIPSNIVVRIAKELVEDGEATHGYLGATLENKFDRKAAAKLGVPPGPTGTLVKKVLKDTPADEAGLQKNDVILAFNGRRIDSDTHLISLVKLADIEEVVELEILRDRERQFVRVQLIDTP